MSLVTCSDVSMSYENHIAVERVSFALEEGDYVCVVGENGSGKSTLMRGILGLQPLRGGSIRYGDGLRQNEIGYLPQQTVIQRDFPASVFEIVLSGCLSRRGWRPFYGAAEKERAMRNLRRLGMEDFRSQSYRNLSGGQQQRVLLARALCATEKLLVLDEPVTGLDPLVTAELYALIDSLNHEDGVAVLMVSHDIASALQHAGKILHLDTGLLYYGPAGEYLSSEAGRRLTGGKQSA